MADKTDAEKEQIRQRILESMKECRIEFEEAPMRPNWSGVSPGWASKEEIRLLPQSLLHPKYAPTHALLTFCQYGTVEPGEKPCPEATLARAFEFIKKEETQERGRIIEEARVLRQVITLLRDHAEAARSNARPPWYSTELSKELGTDPLTIFRGVDDVERRTAFSDRIGELLEGFTAALDASQRALIFFTVPDDNGGRPEARWEAVFREYCFAKGMTPAVAAKTLTAAAKRANAADLARSFNRKALRIANMRAHKSDG